MAEKTPSNNSESFNQEEQFALQIEVKQAEFYMSVLDQEINELQVEINSLSQDSDEYTEISKSIINRRIQQREIKQILHYVESGSMIDTDNFFLLKLKELNNKAEENGSLEIKYLVDMKDHIRVSSSSLRFELESELANNNAIEKLNTILKGRINLAIQLSEDDAAIFINHIIDSIILHKGADWVNKQSTELPLQIKKSNFYRILIEALLHMPVNKRGAFRSGMIYITLQDGSEAIGVNDDDFLNLLDLIIGDNAGEDKLSDSKPEEEKTSVSPKSEMVIPMSLKLPSRRKIINLSMIPESIDLSGNAIDIMVSFVKFSEGFRRNAYLDSAGIATIGWGTIRRNGKAVKLGDTITKEEAEKLLRADIKVRFDKLNKEYVWFKDLNKNQQAAFVSFAYNLGSGIFNKGESLKSVIDNIENVTPRRLAQVFIKYNKARNPKTGKLEEVAGLTNRRNREIELMLRPDNLQDNQRFTVIYHGDTLGETLIRVVDNIEEGNALLSSTLSTRLDHFDNSLSAINPYQTILIEKNEHTYKVTVAEEVGFIIDLHNNVHPVNTPLSEIPYVKVPERPTPYIVASGGTLGKAAADLFPDIYTSSDDASGKIVTSGVSHVVQLGDEFLRDENYLLRNGVKKYLINQDGSVQSL